MNLITVKSNGEFFYMTPDTSLNRDSKDYFCPEFVNELAVVCFYYVRIEKNAKAVAERYAERYVSGFGYGIKLKACNLRGELNPYKEFMASALDNTTYISPCLQKDDFVSIQPALTINNAQIETANKESIEMVINGYPKAVANITSISTLRSGDIIIFDTDFCNTQKTYLKRDGQNQQVEDSKISFGDIDITVYW